jgi:hypothetical protein
VLVVKDSAEVHAALRSLAPTGFPVGSVTAGALEVEGVFHARACREVPDHVKPLEADVPLTRLLEAPPCDLCFARIPATSTPGSARELRRWASLGEEVAREEARTTKSPDLSGLGLTDVLALVQEWSGPVGSSFEHATSVLADWATEVTRTRAASLSAALERVRARLEPELLQELSARALVLPAHLADVGTSPLASALEDHLTRLSRVLLSSGERALVHVATPSHAGPELTLVQAYYGVSASLLVVPTVLVPWLRLVGVEVLDLVVAPAGTTQTELETACGLHEPFRRGAFSTLASSLEAALAL